MMNRDVTIAIIGDYDEDKVSHPATNLAIRHAAERLSLKVNVTWLPTPSFLAEGTVNRLDAFDAIWASSGAPYLSPEGMINAIRFARESGKPFIGT